MIDPAKLLDQFIGGAAGPQALDREPGRQRGSVPAAGGQQSFLGGQGGADVLGRAQDFLRTHAGGFGGGAAAGALAGLLLGTKSGRRVATDVAKIGAIAVLGGLAYKAYTNYRDGKPVMGGAATQPAQLPPPEAAQPAALPGAPPPSEHAILLLRAMIAAASSDGLIDADERGRIIGRLAGAGGEERAFLEAEMQRPWSPAQFAASTTTPEMRSEVYLASLIAIEADTEAERAYLRYLAATIGLDQGLVAHLEATAASAKAPAAQPAA